jgi:hypothetical protein
VIPTPTLPSLWSSDNHRVEEPTLLCNQVEASTYFSGNLRHLFSKDVLIFRAR